VRNVAAEAECSVGSLRHFFTTQSELLVFALRLVVDRVRTRVAALPRPATALEEVEAIAVQMLPLDQERRVEMTVYLALFSAGTGGTELREPCARAHRELRTGCRWMVSRIRSWPEEDESRTSFEAARLHAVIDGLALHLFYEEADADPRWALEVLSSHLREIA
jgi:AcrR family transcriptional regulator